MMDVVFEDCDLVLIEFDYFEQLLRTVFDVFVRMAVLAVLGGMKVWAVCFGIYFYFHLPIVLWFRGWIGWFLITLEGCGWSFPGI